MRVLFLTRSYPSSRNPVVAPFTRDHARAAARFAEVVVLHTEKTRDQLPHFWQIEQEEEVIRVRFRRPPGRTLGHLFHLASAFRGLKEVPFRPDLVHGHFYEAAAVTALLARRLQIPFVLTEHSSLIASGSLSGLEKRAVRRAYRQAARVMPVSRMLQAALESQGFEARYEIVPNVVDLEQFFPAPRRPHPVLRLIAVTRMTPVKGIPDLLEALRLLALRRQDWQCDLIGGGEREEEYRKLAEPNGHVVFHGELERPEVAARLRAADLFVLASRIETFSVATLEALACGVPVVATACGGPEELVTPSAGTIVPLGSPAAMAEALDHALSNLSSFDREDIARTVASRYGFEAIGERLRQVYESVLGNGGGR
ncbi:MAG TPA: glycosyltransferase [Thermoanaerobaculia bacterium]|nr:glycosyltransferase [Thermoanaerobaculia bacterium]